jgi:DNA-directed RNA polymerase
LTFASVHDSYWTHASTIDSMAEVIRDTFILLHSSDVLGKLHQEVRLCVQRNVQIVSHLPQQFKERFKGFKLPLIHLQNKGGNLVKMLSESGVRIVATPEQAKSLESIAAIVEVSETGSSAIGEQPIGSEGEPISDQVFLEELDEEDDSIDEWEGQRKKAAAANIAREAKATRELLGKFVDVVDLLPPLPEKGTFSVQEIKSSPYFFS